MYDHLRHKNKLAWKPLTSIIQNYVMDLRNVYANHSFLRNALNISDDFKKQALWLIWKYVKPLHFGWALKQMLTKHSVSAGKRNNLHIKIMCRILANRRVCIAKYCTSGARLLSATYRHELASAVPSTATLLTVEDWSLNSVPRIMQVNALETETLDTPP
jgi:hypothetical protein